MIYGFWIPFHKMSIDEHEIETKTKPWRYFESQTNSLFISSEFSPLFLSRWCWQATWKSRVIAFPPSTISAKRTHRGAVTINPKSLTSRKNSVSKFRTMEKKMVWQCSSIAVKTKNSRKWIQSWNVVGKERAKWERLWRLRLRLSRTCLIYYSHLFFPLLLLSSGWLARGALKYMDVYFDENSWKMPERSRKKCEKNSFHQSFIENTKKWTFH